MNYIEHTDEELMSLVQDGNRDAFDMLMTRYSNNIYNFILRFTYDTDMAIDLTQETFFKIWKKSKSFKTELRFKPWIYQIARTTAIDQLRKKKTYPFSSFEKDDGDGETFDIADESELPDELFEKKENAQKVTGAIQALNDTEKLIIQMHYIEEMTFEDIAQSLDKPMNSVKSTFRRSLHKLKKILNN